MIKLWNQEVHSQHVIADMAKLGAHLDNDDGCIFYYMGHGDELIDLEG